MSKLIFFDVDGTLSYQGNIIPSVIEAFNELKKEHKVIIATGRCPYQMKDIDKYLQADGYIYCNGKYAKYGDKVLYNEPLDKAMLKSLFKALEEANIPYSVLTSSIYKTAFTDQIINDFSHHFKFVEPKVVAKEDIFNSDIFSINVYSQKEIREIINLFPELTFMRVSPMAYDVVEKNCEKGNCLKYFLDYLGIKSCDTIAIGDNINDLSMLNNVNDSICMGNGNDYVKKQVKYVTKDYLDDGIMHAFTKIIPLIKKE